uniref:Ti plasmid pTi15955 T-DNA region n=1 Tax=Agrobacterium tumefaciens TaxID=358 RepID=Q44391_AGRTU|nr:unnamed protein product [Agrobacterium tumefaciens]
MREVLVQHVACLLHYRFHFWNLHADHFSYLNPEHQNVLHVLTKVAMVHVSWSFDISVALKGLIEFSCVAGVPTIPFFAVCEIRLGLKSKRINNRKAFLVYCGNTRDGLWDKLPVEFWDRRYPLLDGIFCSENSSRVSNRVGI